MTIDEAVEKLDDEALIEFLAKQTYQGIDSVENWSDPIERPHEGTTLEVTDLFISGRISEAVYDGFIERMKA